MKSYISSLSCRSVAVTCCLFLLWARPALAQGPTSPYYLTFESAGNRVAVIQGEKILRTWRFKGEEAAIAVADTVRTLPIVPTDIGWEYKLSGQTTGTSYQHPLEQNARLYDASTDGQYNYSVDNSSGVVYRFNRDWSHPHRLFELSLVVDGITYAAKGFYEGIAFDPKTGSLWLSRSKLDSLTGSTVENRSLDGHLLSSFDVPVVHAAALAVDPLDGTLWFGSFSGGILYQYSLVGVPLSSLAFPELSNAQMLGGDFNVCCRPEQIRLFDPVSSDPTRHLVKSSGLIDQSMLDGTLESRRGAVTDGLSVLLLRIKSDVPVKFSVDDDRPNGSLLPLSASIEDAGASSVVARPLVGSGSFAWAIYRPPTEFGNEFAESREIQVTATPIGGIPTTAYLTLERTPVVLVHGQWDDPTVWLNDGFAAALKVRGFHVTSANYRAANAKDWGLPGNGVMDVQNAIRIALYNTHARGIAATRVDVVAHSMGGLVTRSLIQQPDCTSETVNYCYRARENLNKGWVRRLITMGTPHLGTPTARILYQHRDDELCFDNIVPVPSSLTSFHVRVCKPLKEWMRDTFKRPIDEGSTEAMIPGSNAYRSLGSTCSGDEHGFGYAIAGDHEPNGHRINNLFSFLTSQLSGLSLDEVFEGERHDMVVPVSSAWGKLAPQTPPDATFVNTVHSDSYFQVPGAALPIPGAGVTSLPAHPEIRFKVADLLDSDGSRLGCFPASPWFGLPKLTLGSGASAATSGRHPAPVSRPACASADSPKGVRITAPAPGTAFRQAAGTILTLAAEATGGAVPQGLVFIVGGSVTIEAPTTPPFNVSLELPIKHTAHSDFLSGLRPRQEHQIRWISGNGRRRPGR